MGKKEFTIEEKIKAVELHIYEEMGYRRVSDRYGVPITTLRYWIRKYQTFGVKGSMGRKCNQSYPAELKKCAVEEYLSGKGSLHDICIKYKIYRSSWKILGFVLRTGDPPARVPHAKTVHRTVLAPLLRFLLSGQHRTNWGVRIAK
ncbi:MAG: transposase [Oscillospiraceae bacterium]|nr:transposase [Oscillospiraceae bacterium]